MKAPRRWRGRLISLLLAIVMVAALVPLRASDTKADWVSQLWDVYSQMTGEEQEENVSQDKSDAQKSDKDELVEVGDQTHDDDHEPASLEDVKVEKNGEYTSKWEVAAYIHQYGKLPSNFITKNKAKKLGWDNKQGNLAKVAPGKSIGGDHFGNYEDQLPEKKGRDYYECDIDYVKGYRSEKRIIYSDDGMIFYTEDHYETFDQLYPED